jgi:hypothetical protein
MEEKNVYIGLSRRFLLRTEWRRREMQSGKRLRIKTFQGRRYHGLEICIFTREAVGQEIGVACLFVVVA